MERLIQQATVVRQCLSQETGKVTCNLLIKLYKSSIMTAKWVDLLFICWTHRTAFHHFRWKISSEPNHQKIPTHCHHPSYRCWNLVCKIGSNHACSSTEVGYATVSCIHPNHVLALLNLRYRIMIGWKSIPIGFIRVVIWSTPRGVYVACIFWDLGILITV